MKKLICAVLTAILVLCGFAMAETVYVTISSGQGELVMAQEMIEVSDVDGDGVLTIDDALACAHDAAYEGGAAAGYVSEHTDFGKSIYMLWGEENGGSYGYYVNNASAISPLDPVSEGDSIYAFAYQDLESWSDVFSYFSAADAENAAESLNICLTALVFDADWNQVQLPVEGAVITINGEDSDYVSDAEGKFTLNLSDLAKSGRYVLSAHHDSMTLVPPVAVIEITE